MDVEEKEAMAAAEEAAKKGKKKKEKKKKEKPILSPEQIKALRYKRAKIALLVIAILLAGDLIFGIIHFSVKTIKSHNACSINHSTSKILNEYDANKLTIRDYVVYGETLSLYRYDYDANGLNDDLLYENAKYTLKDACKGTTYEFELSQYLDNKNIDLSVLKEGNYHVYYQNIFTPSSIVEFEVFYPELKYSMYTLPYKKNKGDVNYTRKYIEIGASQSLLLIKVKEEKFLPTDAVYDLAIDYTLGNASETLATLLKQKLEKKGIKVLLTNDSAPRSTSNEISSLRMMYAEKVKYAVRLDVLDENATYFYHSDKIVGYTLIDNDINDNEFINQLGGKALGAGICNSSSSDISCGLTSAKHAQGINAMNIAFSKSISDSSLSSIADNWMNEFTRAFLK